MEITRAGLEPSVAAPDVPPMICRVLTRPASQWSICEDGWVMRNQSKNAAPGKEAGLSPAKRALLAKWLRDGPQANDQPPSGSIPRRAEAAPVGLSFEQQRLWFFHQLEPESPLYTMPIGARLSGPLQLPALQQALDAVAARHEILRTRVTGEDPTLVTDPPRAVPLALIDLTNTPAAEREAEARQLLET